MTSNQKGLYGSDTVVETPRRIDAGTFFTCAIAENDAAYCWGRDLSGELGIEAEIGYVGTVPHPVLAP